MPARDGLSDSERRLARALAHYGDGLILEGETGGVNRSALAAYEAAAREDGGDPRLLGRLAGAYLRHARPAAAIAALEQRARLDPDSTDARGDLAGVYELLGRYDDAYREFGRALKLAPGEPRFYIGQARIRFRQRRDAEALGVLAEALRRQVRGEWISAFLYAQGRELVSAGELTRAIPCFDFLHRQAVGPAAGLDHLIGLLHEQSGDRGAAEARYRAAIARGDALPETHLRLAILVAEQPGATPAAVLAELRRGLARHPADPALRVLAGNLALGLGQYAAAADDFKAAEAAGDGGEARFNASFYLNYGAALERLGRPAEAEVVFERGLTRDPDAHAILNYLAYLWAERGEQLDRAGDYVTRALLHEPENGAYLDTLAWVHYRRGDYVKALHYIRQAEQREPGDATIQEHLGDILEALGRAPEALDAWTRALGREGASPGLRGKIERLRQPAAPPEPAPTTP